MTDSERNQAVRDLTKHCADGRITLDELEERITMVHSATTAAELAAPFFDLPRLAPTVS